MSDWRNVETILTDFFRREGFRISKDGDTHAETGGQCLMAQIGEDRCAGVAGLSINLTKLAHELSA